MPFLYFFGQFTYQLPFYNNKPKHEDSEKPIEFQPGRWISDEEKKELKKKLGGEPTDYFKFEFKDVKVTGVTYNDGTTTESIDQDYIIGKSVNLNGFLADISPHLEHGRFYPIVDENGDDIKYRSLGILDANELPIISGIPNNLENEVDSWTALQSDLHITLRTDKEINMINFSGYFQTFLDKIICNKDFSNDSRFIKELGDTKQLELYFHLSRFEFSETIGNVCGYLGPIIKDRSNNSKIRYKNRRLELSTTIQNLGDRGQLYNDFKLEMDKQWETKLEGTYDILEDKKLLVLRYLDFIPFVNSHNEKIDTNELKIYDPPQDYNYRVYFQGPDNKTIPLEYLGKKEFVLDEKIMQEKGGILIFPISDDILKDNQFLLCIDARKKEKDAELFMYEPRFDLVLKRDIDRGIIIESTESREIIAYLYDNNSPQTGNKVYLSNENAATSSKDGNGQNRSPVIAKFTDTTVISDSEGKITATIKALDIENITEDLFDPVDEIHYGIGSNPKSLPWDRYYGNNVIMKIKNSLTDNSIYEYEKAIPVRVLHTLKPKPEDIPIEEISFKKHIFPLFQYYIKYYPWLHAKLVMQDQEKGYKYKIDFRLSDKDNISWLQVKLNINEIISRLNMKITDKKKMPRSRDLPKNALELIERWNKAGQPP
jgi:hypothetical protein